MSFEDLESGLLLPYGGRNQQIKKDPSQAAAAGVFQITTAVASYQRLVNTLGTPKDTHELRKKLDKTKLHIGQLVEDATAKLREASETDHLSGVSASKKIADAKLAKDFELVLKEFQKAQRLASERETGYAPFIPKEVYSSRNNGSREQEIGSSRNNSQQVSILAESKRQEIALLESERVLNEAIIEEREQGIIEIQRHIGEVNEIFKDLAKLVHDQGLMIDDISSNVDNAHAATGQATIQLKKASNIQRSNSSLRCLLILIFGIILLIVTVVVVA